MTSSSSSLKLLKFNTIKDFLKISNRKIKMQISELLKTHFPTIFSSIDIFDQLQQLQQSSTTNIQTYILLDMYNNTVIAFGQLIRTLLQINKQSYTLKVINLCRDKTYQQFKGAGALLLSILELDATRDSNIHHNYIYLSVDASNTQLQEYYNNLGWINTYTYDESYHNPVPLFIFKKTKTK